MGAALSGAALLLVDREREVGVLAAYRQDERLAGWASARYPEPMRFADV